MPKSSIGLSHVGSSTVEKIIIYDAGGVVAGSKLGWQGQDINQVLSNDTAMKDFVAQAERSSILGGQDTRLITKDEFRYSDGKGDFYHGTVLIEFSFDHAAELTHQTIDY